MPVPPKASTLHCQFLVEFYDVPVGPFLQPGWIPVDGSPALEQVACPPPPSGGVHKRPEGTFRILVDTGIQQGMGEGREAAHPAV